MNFMKKSRAIIADRHEHLTLVYEEHEADSLAGVTVEDLILKKIISVPKEINDRRLSLGSHRANDEEVLCLMVLDRVENVVVFEPPFDSSYLQETLLILDCYVVDVATGDVNEVVDRGLFGKDLYSLTSGQVPLVDDSIDACREQLGAVSDELHFDYSS